MLKNELRELLPAGENSGVEFKRDDVHPDSLAKEIAALLNLEGGRILLGVDDNGAVSGLTRTPAEAEAWVMNLCRENLQPPIIPFWETLAWEAGRVLGVISLPADSPDKPYKARRGAAWVTFVRVGTTSREASREEEARLYQASGWVRYDLKPAPGATLADLDLRRLHYYFQEVRQQTCPPTQDTPAWEQLLLNTDLMVRDRERALPTLGALVLFGDSSRRLVPQSAVTATAYPGVEKDYATLDRAALRAPLISLMTAQGEVAEAGLIEKTLDFVRRNMHVVGWVDERGQRHERPDYAWEAVREAVINALAHRDYSLANMDVELSLYADRLEIISPGRLPNSVTVEKMKAGYRAARNEMLKEVLRDFRYIEASGLGVPRKIIRGMREHNGTEPDLIEEESRFIVRLWKEKH